MTTGNSVPIAVMVSVAVAITIAVTVVSGTPLPVFLLLVLVASLVTLVPVMVLIFPLNIKARFGRPLVVLVIVRVINTRVSFTPCEQNWRRNCRCQQQWKYFLRPDTHGGESPFRKASLRIAIPLNLR